MGRQFTPSTDWLDVGVAAVTVAPLTLVCWFRADILDQQATIVSLGDTAGNTEYFILNVTLGEAVNAFAKGGVPDDGATTSTTFSTNVWHHAAGVFASTTSRSAYLNGGGKTTNVTSVSPSSIDTTAVGRTGKQTPADYFDGSIAEVGIWNTNLSDAQVTSLAGGTSPLFIAKANLKGYWPIFGGRSPERDYSGNGNDLTVNGTPAQIDHPAVKSPFSEPGAIRVGVDTSPVSATRRLTFHWQAKGLGGVEHVFDIRLRGLLSTLVTKPFGGDNAPETNYDVEVLDDSFVDLIGGKGLNRSATVTEFATLNVGAGTTIPVDVPRFRFRVSNAGEFAMGTTELLYAAL